MPSIYGTNTGCCGSGVEVSDLDKFVFSDNKFPLNSGGAFLVKDGNAEDRKAITTTLTINQLDQELTDIGDKNDEQDARLDALEALPVLPTGTQAHEYLYHNGTDWVVGNDRINIGINTATDASSTYIDPNVFIGNNIANGGATYQRSVFIGDNIGNMAITNRDGVALGKQIGNVQFRPYSIGIGAYLDDLAEGCVAIGNRFTSDSNLNDSKAVGRYSIVLGRTKFPVPDGTIYIDANNSGTQTGSPDAGSINIVAELSQLVISEANVDISQQPVADGQRWSIVSTDGSNYQPIDISKIYKNQRMFWTHYTQIGGTPITQVINSTTDFNLFDAPTRRLEYSPDGGAVGGGTTWEYDSVNKVMIWNGADDTPVSIEVNVNIERINPALCVARLLPVFNGSEIGASIEGNACQARLSRNSSTSLHLSFVLSLQNGDELSFLLRKVNAPSNSNIRILYSDVKIYGLRTNELADQITTDP